MLPSPPSTLPSLSIEADSLHAKYSVTTGKLIARQNSNVVAETDLGNFFFLEMAVEIRYSLQVARPLAQSWGLGECSPAESLVYEEPVLSCCPICSMLRQIGHI